MVVCLLDNSLPHIPPHRIPEAVRCFNDALAPGGLVVLGILDGATLDRNSGDTVWTYGARSRAGRPCVVLQLRRWLGPDALRMELMMVFGEHDGAAAEVVSRVTTYYPLALETVLATLDEVGFRRVQAHGRQSGRPLVTAMKPPEQP